MKMYSRLFCTVLISASLTTPSRASTTPSNLLNQVRSFVSDTSGRVLINRDNRYKTFATGADAHAWASEFQKFAATLKGLPPPSLVPFTDTRYARAEEVVNAVWNGYATLYPNIVGNHRPPFTILIDDQAAEAYAVYDPRINSLPLVFFIHTGVFGDASGGNSISRAGLYGLVGHELAHLIFAHVFPGVAETRNIYYSVEENKETLGFMQKNSSEVEQSVKSWMAQADYVGDFLFPEQNGIPVIAMATLNQVLVKTLRDQEKIAPSQTICAQALFDFSALHSFMISSMDQVNVTWPLELDGREKLNSLSSQLSKSGHQCLANGPTYEQAFKNASGMGDEQVNKIFADADLASQRHNNNVLDATIGIGTSKFAKLAELNKSTDYSKLRVRTFEEEADDNSMLVTHFIGEDPHGLGEFFLEKTLPNSDTKNRCREILAKGDIPGYGIFSDPHHGACYRVFHVELYNRIVFGAPTASLTPRKAQN